ncbi:ABC transporter substrate-binding protein [Tessaracoccus coleopterorum]|uniref:ABC transporter substrate-binding protein n=1 Tax=Tessaracoccus coleopterorum TaxID=2714950 RepID=UPI0018D4113E|nr:extracellular solute-binding protein [Tessaracoccus coleopterorum]
MGRDNGVKQHQTQGGCGRPCPHPPGWPLAGCSPDGRESIRFTFSKREAIGFMTDLVAKYNASQDDVEVVIDTSGVDVVSASFVRGNPPDIMLGNYNMEVARFVQRCALSDLGDTDAAGQIEDTYQPLLDQYGRCEGRTSALPYSVMAASVIYNKAIFAEHGVQVPTTWAELIAACDKLLAAGVTPFYATLKDDWTVGQGWFDYTAGGSVDVIDFFERLTEEGTDVGPDSATSFQKDFDVPMERMQLLLDNYINDNAASRGYGDGNLAFANGEAAMYLQGPWAFSEIEKTAPDLELGTFPLPMTDDPADLGVRVNLDLAAMIPERSGNPEAARDFLEYLFLPRTSRPTTPPSSASRPHRPRPPRRPRIAGMVEYVDAGSFYQGPSVLVPKTIPVFNYAQAMALGSDRSQMLATMDADWARLAFRAPVSKEDGR